MKYFVQAATLLLPFLLTLPSSAGEVARSRSTSAPARKAPKILCKEVVGKPITGDATYYAQNLVGNKMACNGKRFSQFNPTAATKLIGRKGKKKHPQIPCGTTVRVTRTDKKGPGGAPLFRDVVITDTGTLPGKTIIDLPTSVANDLGFGPGRDGDPPVKVEICSDK